MGFPMQCLIDWSTPKTGIKAGTVCTILRCTSKSSTQGRQLMNTLGGSLTCPWRFSETNSSRNRKPSIDLKYPCKTPEGFRSAYWPDLEAAKELREQKFMPSADVPGTLILLEIYSERNVSNALTS